MCSGLGPLSPTHMSISQSKSSASVCSSPNRREKIVTPPTDMEALFAKSKTESPLKGMAGQKLKLREKSAHIPAIYLIYSCVRTKYGYSCKNPLRAVNGYTKESAIIINVKTLAFVSSRLVVTKKNWGVGHSIIHETKP